MVKIVVTSDTHLGITDDYQLGELLERIAGEKPELTVLAGDIGEGLSNITRCLRAFAALPGEVAALAGNHDLWDREGCESRDLWDRLLPQAAREAGVLWLEDTVWRRDGVAVAGSVAWYDYSAADPTLPQRWYDGYGGFAAGKSSFSNDARYITWKQSDEAFAAAVGDGLVARLTEIESSAESVAALCVTHVPLFEQQMVRRPDEPHWGFTNAYFGNLTLGRRLLPFRKLRAVVSGHTHIGRTGVVPRVLDGEALPIQVTVIPSGYGKPAYVVVNEPAAPRSEPRSELRSEGHASL